MGFWVWGIRSSARWSKGEESTPCQNPAFIPAVFNSRLGGRLMTDEKTLRSWRVTSSSILFNHGTQTVNVHEYLYESGSEKHWSSTNEILHPGVLHTSEVISCSMWRIINNGLWAVWRDWRGRRLDVTLPSAMSLMRSTCGGNDAHVSSATRVWLAIGRSTVAWMCAMS